jgi:hypothetical protein
MNGEPVSEHTDVGAYALGLLEPADRRAFEDHLATCPACAAELAELPGMKDLLTGLGPVPSATEEPTEAEVLDLLRRRAADERRHAVDRRRRTRWQIALSAAAAVVLLAGGVTVGLATASRPSAPTTSVSLQGKTFSATNPVTHVTGKVGLVAKTWGTMVSLALFHVAGPLDCQIVAVSRTGERQVLGSWLVPPHAHFGLPGHPKPLVIGGPSGIKINDLTHIDVNVVNGHNLVSIPISAA